MPSDSPAVPRPPPPGDHPPVEAGSDGAEGPGTGAAGAPPPAPDPAARARQPAGPARERAAALEGRLVLNGRLRIGAFLLVVVPLLLLETSPRGAWPGLLGLAAVGAVLFLLLVRRHRRFARERDRDLLRERLQHESLARMERRWDDAPRPPLPPPDPGHAYAADLDVVGQGSLAQLLGRIATAPGRAALARALLDPLAPPPPRARALLEGAIEEVVGAAGRAAGEPTSHPGKGWHDRIRARQRAVEALAREPDLLDELELSGREVEGRASARRTLAFLDWAAGGPWLLGRSWAVHLARFLAVFNVAALAAWFAGWVPPVLWVLGLAGAYALNRAVSAQAASRFGAAEGGEHDPARWAGILALADELPRGDPTLDRIREAAATPDPGAAQALGALRRITDVAAARYSGLSHFPLAALFAWDVHVLERLERWQVRYGKETDSWVGAVAELELLIALAGLRHEHPRWTFPEFREEAGRGIEGRDLGHPLLPPGACVGNDVELPPPGRLLLVTGSNMAGKTTLLRALGASQVLGLAGAPVAAGRFVTRPVLPWTAMRVSDSLTQGVSFFMAELRRLRRVVDAARSGPILFLLDEILQGTNTAERRTAARIVLRHLLGTDGVGAVTTHDLTLADAPDLKERSVEIHFREEVLEDGGRRRLHFDYRLRPGPATSRNALLLLEMVGLGEGEGEGGP
jgi:hypothetical protein